MQAAIFAVLTHFLSDHPKNFKRKYQQYGLSFQNISLFLMTMVRCDYSSIKSILLQAFYYL